MAHLAACAACRAELEAMRELFQALAALEPAPAPDMVARVLDRVRPSTPSRLRLGLTRLVAGLQGLAVLALLAWGWGRLAGLWAALRAHMPRMASARVWAGVTQWLTTQWATLRALPETLGQALRGWTIPIPSWGARGISPTQLIALGGAMTAFWLIGNAILLHRAQQNGRTHTAQRR